MTGPLDGYRIIDLTTMISGPVATMMLGDQGADVIKVEAPGSGDLVRQLGNTHRGMTPTFPTTHRSKRPTELNLKHANCPELHEQVWGGAHHLGPHFPKCPELPEAIHDLPSLRRCAP